jgi:hypothetical protein
LEAAVKAVLTDAEVVVAARALAALVLVAADHLAPPVARPVKELSAAAPRAVVVRVEVARAVKAAAALGVEVAPRVAQVTRVAVATQGAPAATAAVAATSANSSRYLPKSEMVVVAKARVAGAMVAQAVVAGAMVAKAGAVVAEAGAMVAEVVWVVSEDSVAAVAAAGKVFRERGRMARN